MTKTVLLAGVLTASTLVLANATAVVASGDPAYAANTKTTGHKVGICHATGSKTNPYVYIVVDQHAADAHKKHQDGRDVIGVSSADKCPKAAQTSDKKDDKKGEVKGTSTTPTPSASPETGKGGPATLPDTGATAGLSALLGLPTLALAGRAYLRSRA
jgi:hypothetical protein